LEKLVIEVEQLNEGPIDIEFELPVKAFDLDEDQEYRFVDPISGSLKAQFAGSETVLLSGSIRVVAKSECVKCLEPLEHNLRVPIRVVFLAEPDEDDKARFDRLHDDDKLYYDHGVIHPTEQLREELMMALPELPQCPPEDQEGCIRRQQALIEASNKSGQSAKDDDAAANPFAAQLAKVRREMEEKKQG